MNLSGSEVVDALKSVIGGGIEKVKEFGELLSNLFDKIDPEALKQLPDNLKELYVNIADKIGTGKMTGAAAEAVEKLEDASEIVLEGGVEYTKFLDAPELLSKVAEKVNIPEVNANVVKDVICTIYMTLDGNYWKIFIKLR